jgi:hypothetical protein
MIGAEMFSDLRATRGDFLAEMVPFARDLATSNGTPI